MESFIRSFKNRSFGRCWFVGSSFVCPFFRSIKKSLKRVKKLVYWSHNRFPLALGRAPGNQSVVHKIWKLWVASLVPGQTNFLQRIDASHCDMNHFSLPADHYTRLIRSTNSCLEWKFWEVRLDKRNPRKAWIGSLAAAIGVWLCWKRHVRVYCKSKSQ